MCIIATLDRLEDFLHYKFENADFPATPARVLEWFRFDFPLAQKGDATTYRHVFRRMMAGPRNRRLPLVRTRADCPRRHPRINCTPCWWDVRAGQGWDRCLSLDQLFRFKHFLFLWKRWHSEIIFLTIESYELVNLAQTFSLISSSQFFFFRVNKASIPVFPI